MADEIEEEILFGHRNDLVGDLDEETESLVRLERQPLRDALAKVLGPGGRIDLESLDEENKEIPRFTYVFLVV